jgi:ferredoxin-thioredoxin reductase catalytic subunit
MTNNVQYPYALDESKHLIYIEDIQKEHRHDHIYHCPECGQEMRPRIGEHNAHHFAHSENQKCGIESYIHKTAKILLARRFNERKRPFMIGLTSNRPCRLFESCKESDKSICKCPPDYAEYDLLNYYDLPAVIEVDLVESDGITHFQPDVLLQSSKHSRKEIFIEVFYKHKSTKDKLASGHQIIEIQVRGMEDLKMLDDTVCFKESQDIRFYNFKPRSVNPDQIEAAVLKTAYSNDIKHIESALPPCKQSNEYKRKNFHIQRGVLFVSGKFFQTGVYENELDNHHLKALMDITFDVDKVGSTFNPLYAFAKKDNRARFCNFCNYCITGGINDDSPVIWCKLVKNGTSRKGTFNKEIGVTCPHFKWATWLDMVHYREKDIVEGVDYSIWINPAYLNGE